MHRRLPALMILAFVLGALACEVKKLPTAPSDLTEGIVVFIDRDYKGTSAHLTSDIANLRDYTGPCMSRNNDGVPAIEYDYTWDNCISSIRVAPGWRAVLYADDHYKGSQLEIVDDVADLRRVTGGCGDGLDDCLSSIRVSRR